MLPFIFMEHPSYRKYTRGIYPKYKFISQNTLKSYCVKRFEEEKKILMGILQSANGREYLTTDTWKSCQDLPFMILTAHFIDDGWRLHEDC